MTELNSKDKLTQEKKVAHLFQQLRKIDQFMYRSPAIKDALKIGLQAGKLGLLMLDCTVAETQITQDGIGKQSLDQQEEVLENSAILYQMDSIIYIVKALQNASIQPSIWTFIGDDDYKYSVSAPWSVSNPEVQAVVEAQIGWISTALYQKLHPLGVKNYTSGWLAYESNHPAIEESRDQLLSNLLDLFKTNQLPDKVKKRMNIFLSWRSNLASQENIVVDEALIIEQAIQEMASLAVQGFYAPYVIKEVEVNLPVIFCNTFPDLATQFLDDECLRLNGLLGLPGIDYGTIHLPGPERFEKFTKQPVKNLRSTILTCGDPKGNKNWPKVKK